MSIEEEADRLYWDGMAKLEEELIADAHHCLTEALRINPNHVSCLIQLGELFLFWAEEMQMEDEEAYQTALTFFDEAIRCDPGHAESWASKSLSLLYLERFEEGLEAAQQGIRLLSTSFGYGMASTEVHENVATQLYDVVFRCYKAMDEMDKAMAVLREGLNYCERPYLLTRHLSDPSQNI